MAQSELIQFHKQERPPLAKHDSTVLDLAFVLDCTASMGSYIHQAQQNIRSIVETIVANEKSDISLALIEYRDHPPQDKTFITRVNDFTPSVKSMKAWLDAASAKGGGDGPEAVACAWHALLKLNWREGATKICVHIADAPPHGLGTNGVGDGFPQGCPDGVDPVETMNKLAEKGVTLYMVGCEPSINASKPFYMAMAYVTGGQYVPLSNASLLSQVIIGGAEEEICLEALMAEVEQDVRQEQELLGGAGMVDEELLSKKIHSKMMSSAVTTKQLSKNKKQALVTPDFAISMSKMRNMSEICEAMNTMAPPPPPEASMMKMKMSKKSAPRSKSRSFFSGLKKNSKNVSLSNEIGPVMNVADMEECMDEPMSADFLATDGLEGADELGGAGASGAGTEEEAHCYSVETAAISEMQVKRMVQKGMKRCK